MKKISLWAKHHSTLAIASIIIIKILLTAIAWYIGSSLIEMNIRIPFIVCIIALTGLVTGAYMYPSRHHSTLLKNKFYTRQKNCDLVVALCSFIMIGTLVNTNSVFPFSVSARASTPAISNPPTAADILSSLEYRDKKSLSKKEKRILKQEFKKQLKVYATAKATGKKEAANKALLIILTIVAAVGLLYVVAALACGLACSGAEGAAIALVLLGTIAIIWGTVAIIRTINRGPRRRGEYLK